MEKDEITDIVKKVMEIQEKEKSAKEVKETKETKEVKAPVAEAKMDSTTEYENQRMEDIIDRKIDERMTIEKENWERANNDVTAKREASWSMVLGIVSIVLSTSLIFGIVCGIYAILLSIKAKRKIKVAKQATAGKVLGIIGLSLTACIYFWVIIYFLAEEVFY